MLRPKLRPTLSRKVKYWGIAPTAQRKLGREARRGSHDLRRLVGHANFLDVLVNELDISDDEDVVNPSSPYQVSSKPKHDEPVEVRDDSQLQSDEDGESTASDENWSEYDSSDDEGHALVRTVSGRQLPKSMEATAGSRGNTMATADVMEDYFKLEHSDMTEKRPDNTQDVSVSIDDNKTPSISVIDMDSQMTPLPSPGDETKIIAVA